MTRIESHISRVFLILLSVIFTLILIEVMANFYLWNIMPEEQFNLYASVDQMNARYGQGYLLSVEDNEDLVFQPHHYLGYTTVRNFDDGKDIHNSLGFRGEEISPEKPDDTFRIVAMGGSTTYGTEVDTYQEAYPYQLQAFLHDEGYTKVEVINAGVGGYTSHENVISLHFRVMPLDPDLLILYHGLNDIHTRWVYPYDAYLPDNSGYRGVNAQSTRIPSILEYSTAMRILGINAGWFISQSSIDWTLSPRSDTSYASEVRSQHRDLSDEVLDGVTVRDMMENNPPIYFHENTKSMIQLMQANDGETVLVPVVTSTLFDRYTSGEVYQTTLQEHADVLADVAEETGALFYDIISEFPEGQHYFRDGRHMSIEGNVQRARLIGAFLIENGLLE